MEIPATRLEMGRSTAVINKARCIHDGVGNSSMKPGVVFLSVLVISVLYINLVVFG